MAGIPQFLGGIGVILEKAGTYIPGRVEKLRNEKAKLEKERAEIENSNTDMDIDNPEHRKKAQRLFRIIDRINTINGLLGSKAKD